MAVRAANAHLMHATLNEGTPDIHLIPNLPIIKIERLIKQPR